MTKDNIIILPHEDLRKRSSRVHVITDATHQLVDDMVAASIDWEKSRPHEISAALAAVQVDRLERVVIIRDNFEEKSDQRFTALINPEIVKYEGTIIYDYEGCLSVSKIYGKVPRYSKIRLKALDINGNEIRLKASGFLARVIQHEIDHTKGIMFVDHLKDSPNSFYKLDGEGELQPIDYDSVVESGIFHEE